jgi:hypothetical protein
MAHCSEFRVRRDGDRFFIENERTGWKSRVFGIDEIYVHMSGLLSDRETYSFDLKVATR